MTQIESSPQYNYTTISIPIVIFFTSFRPGFCAAMKNRIPLEISGSSWNLHFRKPPLNNFLNPCFLLYANLRYSGTSNWPNGDAINSDYPRAEHEGRRTVLPTSVPEIEKHHYQNCLNMLRSVNTFQ